MLTLLTNITGLFKLSKKDIERLWDILVINVFNKKESKLLYSCLDKSNNYNFDKVNGTIF